MNHERQTGAYHGKAHWDPPFNNVLLGFRGHFESTAGLLAGPSSTGVISPDLKRSDGRGTPMAAVHPHLAMVRDRLRHDQAVSSDVLSRDSSPPAGFPPASISQYETRDLEAGLRGMSFVHVSLM